MKLSDYGISQFAATQGARGLVGTPGFIAPEILKYQGREVSRISIITILPCTPLHRSTLTRWIYSHLVCSYMN